jgi:hypothetical protein
LVNVITTNTNITIAAKLPNTKRVEEESVRAEAAE